MSNTTNNFTSAALALLPMIIGQDRKTQIVNIAQLLAAEAGLTQVSASILLEAAKAA